jgi:hypothetical protein
MTVHVIATRAALFDVSALGFDDLSRRRWPSLTMAFGCHACAGSEPTVRAAHCDGTRGRFPGAKNF